MPDPDSLGNRLRVIARVWVDALTYALVVAAAAAVGSLILSLATGGGLVRVKVLLFFGGWIGVAYATVRLWPTSPEDVDRSREPLPEKPGSTRFQALVQALPPVRWVRPPPPERRIAVPGKMLLGSLLVLFVSFLLEAAFGVG